MPLSWLTTNHRGMALCRLNHSVSMAFYTASLISQLYIRRNVLMWTVPSGIQSEKSVSCYMCNLSFTYDIFWTVGCQWPGLRSANFATNEVRDQGTVWRTEKFISLLGIKPRIVFLSSYSASVQWQSSRACFLQNTAERGGRNRRLCTCCSGTVQWRHKWLMSWLPSQFHLGWQ